MKQKKFKFFKIFALCLLVMFFASIVFSAGYYISTTHGISLDNEKLEKTIKSNSFQIVDANGKQLNSSNESYINLSKLSASTTNAFICAEDKRYYKHKGLDYIRIGGAIISNLKTKSFSEGASTISQQLIKNTQLSSEKTIKRKLKEFKLTKELEKKYSKNQILEMYLNNIYFGNGCYGIENASKHYFNKSASKLTLAESALLAGTINAPSVYDIASHTDKAITRRNLILGLMKKYNKISEKEYSDAIVEKVNLNITELSFNSASYNKILEEACKVLKTTENSLKSKNIKIYTSINQNLQNEINKLASSYSKQLPKNSKTATIVIDKNTGGIVSVTGSSLTLSSKKQPGSTIKPILVYAPAFENGIVSPATKILDSKINISGYSPENADKKYHGYVSIRESLKNSYNIPAVKLLNEIGIENAQNLAKKMNLSFEPEDNNLAIALGGLTSGTTLKQIADCYLCFANNGNFMQSHYISKIEKDGKILYENTNKKNQVMSESTAYLITDILKDCSKTGTAKRLKDFSFDIASKTGTVGKANSSNNTDAFNVSYTNNHVILSYIGGDDLPSTINGATYPTMITKDILEKLYSNYTPASFQAPNSVTTLKLDKTEYENNKLIVTEKQDNVIEDIFAKNNLPVITENSLNLKLDVFNLENHKPIICFFASPNYTYKIIRKEKNKEETISSLNNITSAKITKFEDNSAKNNKIYEYFVEICEKSTNKIYKTNSIKLKTF